MALLLATMGFFLLLLLCGSPTRQLALLLFLPLGLLLFFFPLGFLLFLLSLSLTFLLLSFTLVRQLCSPL